MELVNLHVLVPLKLTVILIFSNIKNIAFFFYFLDNSNRIYN